MQEMQEMQEDLFEKLAEKDIEFSEVNKLWHPLDLFVLTVLVVACVSVFVSVSMCLSVSL